jgi:hypothetical protein
LLASILVALAAPAAATPLADVVRLAPAGSAAANDTLLLLSHGSDAVSGGCNPRGWTAEVRTTFVVGHGSDRHVVNHSVFRASPTAKLALPAPIAGTIFSVPVSLAVTDSGTLVYAESACQGNRVVEVYRSQNALRKYADLPTAAGVKAQAFRLCADRGTGGVILCSLAAPMSYLYRITPGGGVPAPIAGNAAGSPLDTAAVDAFLAIERGAITTNADGNVYFNERTRVRMLRTDGRIVTLAGNMTSASAGDGGPAIDATFSELAGLALGGDGTKLYVVDGPNGMRSVRVIDLVTGQIAAVPGAQGADFGTGSPGSIAESGGALYIGLLGGELLRLSGGTLEQVASGAGDDAVTYDPVLATTPITEFALSPLFPNPARGAIAIEYAVAREANVRLTVIDVAGRIVATLANGTRAPGLYHATWPNGRNGGAAPGTYFVRFEGGGLRFVRRLVLMR